MRLAQIKAKLQDLGLHVLVRRAQGGGHTYSLRRGPVEIGSGWDHGSTLDAARSAYEHAIDMQRRAAAGGAA